MTYVKQLHFKKKTLTQIIIRICIFSNSRSKNSTICDTNATYIFNIDAIIQKTRVTSRNEYKVTDK